MSKENTKKAEKAFVEHLEQYATNESCPRHIAKMKVCLWDDNKPCECRKIVTELMNNQSVKERF